MLGTALDTAAAAGLREDSPAVTAAPELRQRLQVCTKKAFAMHVNIVLLFCVHKVNLYSFCILRCSSGGG